VLFVLERTLGWSKTNRRVAKMLWFQTARCCDFKPQDSKLYVSVMGFLCSSYQTTIDSHLEAVLINCCSCPNYSCHDN